MSNTAKTLDPLKAETMERLLRAVKDEFNDDFDIIKSDRLVIELRTHTSKGPRYFLIQLRESS